jgi:hypothetical protein
MIKKITQGYIDHASISSALAVLSVKDAHRLSMWDRQCLIEATYLLLFSEIGIIPGPSNYRGASGVFSHVISSLPTLTCVRFDKEKALQSTNQWLSKEEDSLRTIWIGVCKQSDFIVWSRLMRELYWIDHVKMFGALFDNKLMQRLPNILNCSIEELQQVQHASKNETTVHQWLKSDLAGDDAKLANDAYLLAILIRGKFHEYLASSENLHLCPHPFRKLIQKPWNQSPI